MKCCSKNITTGFTIIELLISIAIMSVLLWAIVMLVMNVFQSISNFNRFMELDNQRFLIRSRLDCEETLSINPSLMSSSVCTDGTTITLKGRNHSILASASGVKLGSYTYYGICTGQPREFNIKWLDASGKSGRLFAIPLGCPAARG